MRVLAAADKFKGTASAAQICAAIGHACWALNIDCTEIPMADGGEGTLDVLGGPNRTTLVTGPLGQPVEAAWRLHRGVAVIEMARASGLTLAGGPAKNDPLNATTQGVGELIDTALNAGARKIIVCLGGSATTDGGLGALKAIGTPARLLAVEFLVACDVDTLFTDAAKVFAPQKGATPAQVGMLTGRLEQLAQRYERDYGINVARMPGSGAAGGLAGGLAALGAKLIPGFDIVAEENGFDEAVKEHDIVITGEGLLDDTSFDGKVVGSVFDYAQDAKKRTLAIVGDIDEAMDASLRAEIETISITEMFGTEMALQQVLRCVEDATTDVLKKLRS
ncbi:MAG: glycerate kinase [Ilumatobacteraceae bacterium]|nr:glycerate kinase [Ilumatobacteraceae bacterium]